MSVGDQIGVRIREKRVQLRIRQSQLAKIVGISPSYLNLIEHNRRRIGGKLLTDLAEALAIDIDLLSENGKSSKVARLEEARALSQSGNAGRVCARIGNAISCME